MAQTLDTLIRGVEIGEQHLTYEGLKGRDTREAERFVDSVTSVLQRVTTAERISASRHGGFTRWERWVWAARYPEGGTARQRRGRVDRLQHGQPRSRLDD
jgi:hypothetical protein